MRWMSAVLIAGFGVICAPAQDERTEPTPGGASAERRQHDGAHRAPARVLPTRKLLNLRIARAEFDQTPLADVLEQLGAAAGTNVVARWNKLEEAGVERDRPISLRARNLRFAQVLWIVLNEAGGPETRLAYRAAGNMVVISTADDFREEMVIRVYDVRDLIATVPFQAGMGFGRTTDTVTAVNRAGANGLPGFQTIPVDSGVRLFTTGDDEDDFERELREGPDRNMQELIDAITGTVEPDSWAVNGGPGTIRPWRGRLIVRNSPLVHQKIGGPLRE